MKSRLRISVFVCLVFAAITTCPGQDIDMELGTLAEKLAGSIKEHGNKKITVVDFVDLHGAGSELGKYIAEQLTIDFVAEKRDFSVLDRGNLKSILAEHKLTASGLVDPENAKKLGMFAGVDAMILGTYTLKNKMIQLTAKIITTETAEIAGGAKTSFRADDAVLEMISHGIIDPKVTSAGEDGPNISKSFGDLRVEISPMQVVNGKTYRLTMMLTNSSRQSLWLGLKSDSANRLGVTLTDAKGNDFQTTWENISGLTAPPVYQEFGKQTLTELRAGSGIVTTAKLFSNNGGLRATPGQCKLQVELIVANDPDPGSYPVQNVVTKVEAR